MFEKAGKLKIKVIQGPKFLEFELVIPELYPAEKCELKFLNCNFEENFVEIFEARA